MILRKLFFILKNTPALPQAMRTMFFEAQKSCDFLASQFFRKLLLHGSN
jgi:hypothetical protein